jgi:hypothetical protein
MLLFVVIQQPSSFRIVIGGHKNASSFKTHANITAGEADESH